MALRKKKKKKGTESRSREKTSKEARERRLEFRPKKRREPVPVLPQKGRERV